MNYAIYKTFGDGQPRIVHRFTQEQTNHRAKSAARAKLDDIWRETLRRQSFRRISNAKGTADEISYDYPTSIRTHERVRLYIAPLKSL